MHSWLSCFCWYIDCKKSFEAVWTWKKDTLRLSTFYRKVYFSIFFENLKISRFLAFFNGGFCALSPEPVDRFSNLFFLAKRLAMAHVGNLWFRVVTPKGSWENWPKTKSGKNYWKKDLKRNDFLATSNFAVPSCQIILMTLATKYYYTTILSTLQRLG